MTSSSIICGAAYVEFDRHEQHDIEELKTAALRPLIWRIPLWWVWQLLIFGGHGTGGWLTRYDVYHNDCVVLDRGT